MDVISVSSSTKGSEFFHRHEQETTGTGRTSSSKSCRATKRRFRDGAIEYSSQQQQQQQPHAISPLSPAQPSFFIYPPQSPNPPPHQHQNYTVVTQSSDGEMDTAEDCDARTRRRRRHNSSHCQPQQQNKKFRTMESHPLPQRPNAVEWWKRNQKPTTQNHRPSSSSPSPPNECHVCESYGEPSSSSPSNETHTFPRNQENDRHRQPAIEGRKPKRQTNSLLSYFRATTMTNVPFATATIAPDASAPPPPRPMRTAILRTCYYCDRWCCSTCTRTCERCAGGYYTFCSTINYDRPEERTYCLDCEEDPDDDGGGGVDEDMVMGT